LRGVFANGPEQACDKALRRPVGHCDFSAGPAYADHFARGPLLIRREHDAKGRNDDIEAVIRERKSLRVGFLEGDGQALGFGTFATAVEKGADVVRRYDLGEAAWRGKRRIAVARGDIEDAMVAAEVDRLARRPGMRAAPGAPACELETILQLAGAGEDLHSARTERGILLPQARD
jgi:hypothetical protein